MNVASLSFLLVLLVLSGCGIVMKDSTATQVTSANATKPNNTVLVNKYVIDSTYINQPTVTPDGILTMIAEVKDFRIIDSKVRDKYFESLTKQFIDLMRINKYSTLYIYSTPMELGDNYVSAGELYLQAQNIGFIKEYLSKYGIQTVHNYDDRVGGKFVILIAGKAPEEKRASAYNVPINKTSNILPAYVVTTQLPNKADKPTVIPSPTITKSTVSKGSSSRSR